MFPINVCTARHCGRYQCSMPAAFVACMGYMPMYVVCPMHMHVRCTLKGQHGMYHNVHACVRCIYTQRTTHPAVSTWKNNHHALPFLSQSMKLLYVQHDYNYIFYYNYIYYIIMVTTAMASTATLSCAIVLA